MSSNRATIGDGFQLLLESFAPYIAMELQRAYGDDWWRIAVMQKLYDDQSRDLPMSGDWADLVDSLDIQRALLLFDLYWNEIFKKKLSIDNRTWAKELTGVRNKWAHIGGKDFTDDDTWRALDTMSRLCEQLDSENAEKIRGLLRKVRYGSEEGSTVVTETTSIDNGKSKKKDGILSSSPDAALSSWRDVMSPHPDVAQGRYRNAEFAADLAQVARGEGSLEYRDPVEFFARTYVTDGMKGLLGEALKRVCGKDGEPVIQLKTAFGGGKTHSMLALYHMMRGGVSIEKIPAVKPALEAVGISSLPKANVAVLVGTALDPTKSRRPANLPGVTVNTLWGEMAAQLAISAGDPKIYDIIKESDKRGVSPGSEVLKNLFDSCAPCIILMDELVAYAKKIYGVKDLPSGSFDNFISFIQEITEAAKASKNSVVVASIPESDIEIGGEAGKTALESIEHTFGRMESIWKPVAANEGFEVVRRRLFLDCKNPDAREAVCSAFSAMYQENAGDFPIEAKELEYKERMISCYPIHPEIFDRLYEDWATLERFQRTRGVLRLMAAVIHELWMGNDAGLMIMPGSISLDVPSVRDELTRHLDEGWNSVVDSEVDGRNSEPYRRDQATPRYGGILATRRVARTVMLGSAPSSREMSVRGIEGSRVRLGVVQPRENIAIFNDALSTLQSTLSYLYTNSSGDRYWYDTRPTLRKLVADRAQQVATSDVEYEIETRLRKLRMEAPFSGVHVCPGSSLDVPDDQSVRLVILSPQDVYKASKQDSPAMMIINEILNTRGTAPRIYRNTLAFLAADHDGMASLKQEVGQYLAWKSVTEESEQLNLDATQNRDAHNSLKRSNETVEMRIGESYRWLLTPYVDRAGDPKEIIWDTVNISGGQDTIVKKAASKMEQNESLITKWAPALLLMELDNLLWKDQSDDTNTNDIQIRKLWEQMCTYCYLPRLANYNVLEDAIITGVNSKEYFGYAAMLSDGRYVDLKFDGYAGIIDQSGLLVKVSAVNAQIEAEQKAADAIREAGGASGAGTAQSGAYISNSGGEANADTPNGGSISDSGSSDSGQAVQPNIPTNKHFYLSADLDLTRINRDVSQIVDEIIRHLSSEQGSVVKVTLDVDATALGGITPQTVRTVSENCRTLKIKDFGFDD